MTAMPSDPSPLLEMRNISKGFRGVQALDEVQLSVRSGSIHALMGENGAGKSTLIKVLNGIYAPDSGSIRVAGRAIHPQSPRDAEAQGISTVFQEINLIPTLSVADNILLERQPRRWGWIRQSECYRRAKVALQRIGLSIDVRQPLNHYSLAVQQLVAIARALDVDAKLLVLDEPTSSLDEREVASLFRVLEELKAQGLGILWVTHFLDQVYAISDTLTVLRNGRGVGEFSTQSFPRACLVGAMLGREIQESSSTTLPSVGAHETRAPILELRGIGKTGMLRSMDLKLHPGEVHGLAGLLGSGRTETAHLTFGVARPDTGTLCWQGKERSPFSSPREAMQHGLAFCSEDRKAEGILPHLSVRENLILAMQANRGPLRLMPRQEQDALAAHYIQALKIKTPSAETPIQNLSGGNQQKVLLARWLAIQPKVILLDEPTRGIDVGAKSEVEKLIRSLRDQGMAVLLISSDLEEIVRTCERLSVMRDRKKIAQLHGPEVQVASILRAMSHHDE